MKNKWYKILNLFLSFVLCFSLIACDDEGKKEYEASKDKYTNEINQTEILPTVYDVSVVKDVSKTLFGTFEKWQAVGEEIGDMLGKDIGTIPVKFPPAGVIRDKFTRGKGFSFFIHCFYFRESSCIVHLIADTEDRHRGVIAVLEDAFLPAAVVHGEFLFVAL